MRRREFFSLVGGAAAWPMAARGQQAMPVVGYVSSGSRAASSPNEVAFRQGLGSMGFFEGRNVAIDYRYAENQRERLPVVATELVRRQADLIYATDNPSAVAAKAATATIPIVFRIGADPIQLGLVASLARPGANVTGVSFLVTTTGAVRLQMLHESVPNAVQVGLLVNPANPYAEVDTREAQEAASKLGLKLQVVNASNPQEIDAAFSTLVQRGVQALVIDGETLFGNRRQQLAALALRHGMPAIYTTRDFPEAGGLMSYGASTIEASRLGGVYVGRVLKGDKPADLPVQQSVKVELRI
jgi:putative ABC transport system substrate-binding protein